MNPAKFFFNALAARLSAGLFIKLRHAFPNPLLIWRAFRQPQAAKSTPQTDEQVVVVGIGPAAMSCLQELKREGFSKVTVVAKDRLFGGKCVNAGCMPIQFALGLPGLNAPMDQRASQVQAFVGSLRKDVQRQFDSTGYELLAGTAVSVQGKQLKLADGSNVGFDRLIVAAGNTYPLPPRLPADLKKRISIDEFWQLPTGSRVVIYAEGNITALSLGDIAARLGLQAHVLLAGSNLLAAMPSYKYFVREMGKRGVPVYENARLLRASDNEILFENNGKSIALEYDYLLVLSKPVPTLIEIDGELPTIYDIDLVRASLPARPDIVFIGDSLGLFTAAEADLQAKLLMRCWKYGESQDFRALDQLPLCIHGEQSLAMVGEEWTYTARHWQEVDFRALGWSKAEKQEGKLWYILDETSGKFEALHICHKHAGELICIGAALMDQPVWSIKWLNSSIHPSGAEIFKVAAEQAQRSLPDRSQASLLKPARKNEHEFALPDISDIHPGNGLPAWINSAQYAHAILHREPGMLFAVYFGLSKLANLTGKSSASGIARMKGNRIQFDGQADVLIEVNPDTQTCRITRETTQILVRMRLENPA